MIPNLLLTTAVKVGYSAYVGDGTAIWSAIHIDDGVDLIVSIMLDGRKPGGAVSPAEQSLTMLEVATAVAAAFDPPLALRSVSAADAGELWVYFAPAFELNQHLDGASALRDFGWDPPSRDFPSEVALTASLLSCVEEGIEPRVTPQPSEPILRFHASNEHEPSTVHALRCLLRRFETNVAC